MHRKGMFEKRGEKVTVKIKSTDVYLGIAIENQWHQSINHVHVVITCKLPVS